MIRLVRLFINVRLYNEWGRINGYGDGLYGRPKIDGSSLGNAT